MDVRSGENPKSSTRRWWSAIVKSDWEARQKWRSQFPTLNESRDWGAFERLPETPGALSRNMVSEMAQASSAESIWQLTEIDLKAERKRLGFSVIGHAAFAQSKLTRIVIPEGVQVIGPFAFYGCRQLEEVVLPRSLVVIASDAFENCSHLSAPRFARCSRLVSIGERAFAGCSSRNFTSLKFPKNLRGIGMFAFRGCTRLEEVRFNPELRELGYGVFNDCIELSSVKKLPLDQLGLEKEPVEKPEFPPYPRLEIALGRRFRKTPYARREGFQEPSCYYVDGKLEEHSYPF